MSVPTNADETLLISADGYEQRCRELDALRNEAQRELSERLREATPGSLRREHSG